MRIPSTEARRGTQLRPYPFTPVGRNDVARSASGAALRLRSGAHVATYALLRSSARLAREAACATGFLVP